MFNHQENKKIKTVWFKADPEQFLQSPFEYVNSIQKYSGSILFISEKVAEVLEGINPIVIMLKYEIPEQEQEKITLLYNEVKRTNYEHLGTKEILYPMGEVELNEIINFAYYTGYCKYSRVDKSYEFHPCDSSLKEEWFDKNERNIECRMC